MQILVLNDVHLGVQRRAGTTPASSNALREYLFDRLQVTMDSWHGPLLFNGDLFDGFNIPLTDVHRFISMVAEWLAEDPRREAHLGRGNHDISQDSSRLSSFDFAGAVLRLLSARVFVYTTPGWVKAGLWIIPHMPNQDLFDQALNDAPGNAVVMLHANYDNNFAVESDHSLNVSEEQARSLIARGCRLVFAHEHQADEHLNGDVIVVGNQWPSSVADCLGNDTKRAVILDNAGDRWDFTFTTTWKSSDSDGLSKLNWTDLPAEPDAGFVRVGGKASAEQATAVVDAIARLRQKSDAFVVTNAVEIEGVQISDDIAATVEAVRGFDAIAFLFEHLDEKQREVVRSVMSKESA